MRPAARKRFAFLKFFAHLSDRAARLKRGAEGRDAARAQFLQLFATLRDEFVLLLHLGDANLNRKHGLNRTKSKCCRLTKRRR